MISINAADALIQKEAEALQTIHTEKVNYSHLCGRILAEDVNTLRDHPAFDRVTMDGIAINCNDWLPGKVFPLQHVHYAGDASASLLQNHCIEVMTGAEAPRNSNCIIPFVQLHMENGEYRILSQFDRSEFINAGRNIHYQGSDATAGSLLLPKNTRPF